MTDILYIRLGSQQQHVVHWLVWSPTEKMAIEQGELASATEEQLSTLKETALNRQVIVLVPGNDVSLKALKVPGKSQRAIRLAAPYMLEDDLAQDVEQLFFAYANINKDAQDNNCFVAAVDKQSMENWLLWLSDAGIQTRVMIPDVLALPFTNSAETKATPSDDESDIEQAPTSNSAESDEHWHTCVLDNQVLIRQSEWQTTVVDKSFWYIVTQSWQKKSVANDQSIRLTTYSTLPAISGATLSSSESDSVNVGINVLPTTNANNGLAVLAEHYQAQPTVNLLQGEFKIVQKRSAALTNWFWAAGFVVAALLVNLIYKGAELANKENHIAAIEKEIISVYKDAFPKTKRVRINTIKSQLKNKMSDVGAAGAGDSFLPMLTKLQPAFSLVPELVIESLKFDEKKQEIRIQANGDNFQAFEKFRSAVVKMGMEVKQGAQNNQGDRVSGSFSITNVRGK